MTYCTPADVRFVTLKFINDATWNNIDPSEIDRIIVLASQYVLIDIARAASAADVGFFLANYGYYPPVLVRATALRAALLMVNRYSFLLSEGDTGIVGRFTAELDDLVEYLCRTGLTDGLGEVYIPAPVEITVLPPPMPPPDITSTFPVRRAFGWTT